MKVAAGSPQTVSATAEDQKQIVGQSGTITYSNTAGSGTLTNGTPLVVQSNTTLSVASGRGYVSVLDVRGSVDDALRTSGGAAPVSILEPRFNLPPEGVDSAATIAAASAIVAAEGRVLKFPGGRTYDAGAGISITHDDACWVLDDDAVIDGADVADGAAVISVAGATSGSAIAITGPVDPLPEDSYTIGLASAYSGLAAGDYVIIASDETRTTYQETTYKRETRQVASVSDTTVTLAEPLQDSYAISGQTITLQKVEMVDKFRIAGGKIQGEGGASSGQYGIELKYATNAEIRGVHVAGARRQGIRIIGALDWLVDGVTATGSDEDSLGYGVTVAAERGRIVNSTFRDCRHGIDISGGSTYAVSRGVVVDGNTISNCTSSGIGTHAGAEYTVFSNNTIEGCGGGIVNRSAYTVIDGNTIRGTRSAANSGSQSYLQGIYIQRELGATNLIVTNNIVDLGGAEERCAIYIGELQGNVENVLIANNLLRNFGQLGIYVNNTGNIRNFTIRANTIDCREQLGTWHGILLDADADTYTKTNVSITDNLIDTPLDDGIRVHGGYSSSYRATGVQVTGNTVYGVASGNSGVDATQGYFAGGCVFADNHTPGHAAATADYTGNCGVKFLSGFSNFSVVPLVYGNTYGARRGSFTVVGDVDMFPAGSGLNIAEGTNGRMGLATLSAGTVTVATTEVTANSRILLTAQALGTVAAPKAIAVTGRNAGQDFTITSEDNTDTSTVAWTILEPASVT